MVILKTSTTEHDLRQVLPSLELTLSAHATDAVPQGSGNAASASGKHDLGSRSFAADSFTDIVPLGDKTYVIWKLVLQLSRPRARLQRPAIYFTANLTISSTSHRTPRGTQEELLQEYEPLPSNVLEPFQFDPVLRSSTAFLPESRITKVAPKPPNPQDSVKPIRGATKRAFPAVPALFSRIRYSALPDAVIASLHLETSHVIAGTVTVEKVELAVPNAQVEHLTNVSLPLETRAGDETVILYRLKPDGKDKLPEATAVSISIMANATLDQGSRIKFNVDWEALVDLTQTTAQPFYRWSRPLSGISGHHRGLSTQSNPGFVSSDVPQRYGEGEAGVTFIFTALPTTHKGSEFKLDVLCNNRSGRPRRFALLMLQPRKPKVTIQAQATHTETDLVASIFNAPPLERTKPPDVLDLSPDVRIGPLPPGACFETQLTLQALTTGVLDLGVLRILDLDTRHMIDVKELPDIVALSAADAELR